MDYYYLMNEIMMTDDYSDVNFFQVTRFRLIRFLEIDLKIAKFNWNHEIGFEKKLVRSKISQKFFCLKIDEKPLHFPGNIWKSSFVVTRF